MPSLIEFKKEAAQQLKSPSAKLDIDYLLSEYTGISLSQLCLYESSELSQQQLDNLNTAIEKRSLGEPIAYIIGHWGFWKYDFYVNKHTLIPRPDTEVLIETVLSIFNNEIPLEVLDIGTGSGIIPICLAKERSNWRISATDISTNALKVAKKNADKYNVAIDFYQGDLFSALPANAFFDLIISNPPYVEQNSKYLNDKSIQFEPMSALIGGEIGTEIIEEIIIKASTKLYPKGYLVLESASWQIDTIKHYMNLSNFQYIDTIKDYSNNLRVSIGQLL